METQKIIVTFIFFFAFWSLVSVSAQAPLDNCACCGEHYDDFDYWIGEWVVYDTAGTIVGHNNIVRELDGCAIKESWVSNRYNRGNSINYYDRSDSLWHHVWVDNTGSVLELYGGVQDGVMVLRSDEINGQNGAFYNQIHWVKMKDHSVHQIWDVISSSGEKRSNLFTGTYKKRR